MTDTEQSDSASTLYSPLAWQLARQARMEAVADGEMPEVRASVAVYDGNNIVGVGTTSSAAMHDLAVQLDRWNQRTGV